MIKEKIQGLLGLKISLEEMEFIFRAIKEDIVVNRIKTRRPVKTGIWHIYNRAVLFHDLWIRSQRLEQNRQKCRNLPIRVSQNEFMNTLLQEN